MKTTNFTENDVRNINDNEFIAHCKIFLYYSQWENKNAFALASYRLALMQGSNYQKTGNIKSFTKMFY